VLQKVGLGYDVHRFIKGKKLFLGGVEIPHGQGLEGHSDADVVLHAICDAILGALGKGDIGEHFPNTDMQYKDIASTELLRRVHQLVLREGFKINNIDTVLMAQEPNIKAFKQQMRGHIAKTLGLEQDRVNIKATTNEGLGFVGRREGLAAQATVLLAKK